jgi:hypothetical protein
MSATRLRRLERVSRRLAPPALPAWLAEGLTVEQRVDGLRRLARHGGGEDPFPHLGGEAYLAACRPARGIEEGSGRCR